MDLFRNDDRQCDYLPRQIYVVPLYVCQVRHLDLHGADEQDGHHHDAGALVDHFGHRHGAGEMN